MYTPNPVRGCGTKKADSMYLEGGTFSAGGALHAWTHVFGDGMEAGTNLLISQAPLGMTWFNPAATLATGEVVWADAQFIPRTDTEAERYAHFKQRTREVGLLDHVGTSHYTAHEFMEEVREYGPSRKVPKSMARSVATVISRIGSIPIFFTHSDLPLFRDYDQQEAVLDAIRGVMTEEVDWSNHNFDPAWEHLNWGMYARDQHYRGDDHYMRLVTSYVSAVKTSSRTDYNWLHLKEMLAFVPLVEQIFGASWVCKVSYTLRTDGTADEDVLDIPGLHIIDLDREDSDE